MKLQDLLKQKQDLKTLQKQNQPQQKMKANQPANKPVRKAAGRGR